MSSGAMLLSSARAASRVCRRFHASRAIPSLDSRSWTTSSQARRFASSAPQSGKTKAKANDKDKDKDKAKDKDKEKEKDAGDRESIAITPRKQSYSRWYNELVTAADMLDSSPVRGCMVIKPWGMSVWDLLRSELDKRIANTGAQNAYFPLLIPQSFLAKEAQHVDGFAKECAVVTHHRLKLVEGGEQGQGQGQGGGAQGQAKTLIPDPDAELEEPLVIRPTSETIIWHMFGKWIRSHRDLPLKVNQWANVLRWEMRTRPFLRSMEFLWQEGHTAHATAADAINTARESLDVYADVCEQVLAVPVIKGTKSPSERFAGAVDTYTIEAVMQNGWALQSGTSHFLGQNFAKAFDVCYQNEVGHRELVWATSWGVSTRLIGALLMTHSDDKGVVLPPAVAPLQVVLVPIKANSKGKDESGNSACPVTQRVLRLQALLKKAGVRVKVDDREHLRPGAKYFEWERKGVPLRLDVGPRDVAEGAHTAALTWRHTGRKESADTSDDGRFVAHIEASLRAMQAELLQTARQRLQDKTMRVSTYKEMEGLIRGAASASPASEGGEDSEGGEGAEGQQLGLFLVPWRCDAASEQAIKEACKATLRCYPFEHNAQPPPQGTRCFYSGLQATHMAIFARAF